MATTDNDTRSGPHDPAPAVASGGSWRVVAHESRVGFAVKKMGLYFVKGRFKGVTGEIRIGPDGVPESGQVTIDADTISTRMPPRDLHLRTRDFLEVKRYPRISIRAERVDPTEGGEFLVRALFEIRGHGHAVELHGRLDSAAPGDGERVAARVSGVIDRHDFGIRPRQPFEMVVGRDVQLDVELVLERVP